MFLIPRRCCSWQWPQPCLSAAPSRAADKRNEVRPEKRAAKVLFEEAQAYLVDRKFTEFNKQKIPYDQKLEAKTKQEQKDLAAKYAAVLQSRKSSDRTLITITSACFITWPAMPMARSGCDAPLSDRRMRPAKTLNSRARSWSFTPLAKISFRKPNARLQHTHKTSHRT